MNRIGKVGAMCMLAAISTLPMGCPDALECFTIRVINESSDLYVVSVFLAQLEGQNLTVVSENLLLDDVDPANDDEFRVLLSLADRENANAIGYILEDLNGFTIENNAVLSEGFSDGVRFTLTVVGDINGGYDVEFERDPAKAGEEGIAG